MKLPASQPNPNTPPPLTRRSLIVGGALTLASLAAWALTSTISAANTGRTVRITNSDGVVQRFSLNEPCTVEMSTSLGSNTIEIANQQVRVLQASCAGADCVHQGAISSPAQSIVCLPNRLVIQLEEGELDESAPRAQAVDVITG